MEPTVHSSVAGEVTSGNYTMNADTGYYFVSKQNPPETASEPSQSPAVTESVDVKDKP